MQPTQRRRPTHLFRVADSVSAVIVGDDAKTNANAERDALAVMSARDVDRLGYAGALLGRTALMVGRRRRGCRDWVG